MFSNDHLDMKNSLFKDNQYTKQYYKIVVSAKLKKRKRNEGIHLENHHIIPDKIGGPNISENMVMLTCREHFVCHRLLTRMCIDSIHRQKMGMAISYFMTGCKNHPGRKFTSRDYENARKDHIGAVKGICPAQYVMEAAWTSRRGVPLSDAEKLKLSIALKRPIMCQLIGPNDEIYETEDLEKFCNENGLKYNYLRQLVYKKDDIRMVIPKSRGWGIYLGVVQPIGDYGKIKSEAVSKGWVNRKGEASANAKKWVFQDPDGNIHEFISLSKFCNERKLPYSQASSAPIGKVLVNSWAGWIKLSCTLV